MSNVFLFGTSGHAKVVLDIVQLMQKFRVKYMLDDDERLHEQEFLGVRTIGGQNFLGDDRLSGMKGLVSIGDNTNRKAIFELMQSSGHEFFNAIHPQTTIAASTQLGTGIVVTAGVVINPGAVIGDNTILNTSSTVDHDCRIGSHVHIAPGCNVCGHVQIGDGALIGAGSTIVPSVKVGEGAVVGAGATVTQDVAAGQTVIGTPARTINK